MARTHELLIVFQNPWPYFFVTWVVIINIITTFVTWPAWLAPLTRTSLLVSLFKAKRSLPGMDEDERPPCSPKRPQWKRRIFTTEREKAHRMSRADTTSTPPSLSSTQLVLPDGVPDEDFVAANAAVAFRRPDQPGTPYEEPVPPCDEPRPLLSQSKSFEQGIEDLGYASTPRPKPSAIVRKPATAPLSRRPPPELAADMGDAACLVALSSQRRHRKQTSYPVLQARDSEFIGSLTREGGASQIKADALEIQEEPSIEVSWRREIQAIERQPPSGTQAMPVLARQKKSPIQSYTPDATGASPSVASTSTRKPLADGEKKEPVSRSAAKRQGLKIDISFGKSARPDKDGMLLKSISSNVEKIVARLLARYGEDRQPLSHADNSETAVIEVDSQGRVSVDVTIADEVGERRQPPTSPVKASNSQAMSKAVLPATVPLARATPTADSETADRRRQNGPRRAPTPASVVHLTVGPIHFGHSQPGFQAISQADQSRRGTKRRKIPADYLSAEGTPSRIPRGTTASQRGRQSEEEQSPPAQAEPVETTTGPQIPREPMSSETQMKTAKEMDASSGRAVDKDVVKKEKAQRPGKAAPVPGRRPSRKSLPSVHEMSSTELSPGTGDILPARKRSIVDKEPVMAQETPSKSPVSSQETQLTQEDKEARPTQKADKKRKMASRDKRKLSTTASKTGIESVAKSRPVPARKSSMEALPSVYEMSSVSALPPDRMDILPPRKKSSAGKKPVTAPTKESPTVSSVSPQEAQPEQETKRKKSAQKADTKTTTSSADKRKLSSVASKKDGESVSKPKPIPARKPSLEALPSVHEMSSVDVLSPETGESFPARKKSITDKKPATEPTKESPMASPVSPQETQLEQESKRAKAAQKASRKSEVSSPDKDGLAAGAKKSAAKRKRTKAHEKRGSLKSLVSPEETLPQEVKRTKPLDETLKESKLSSPGSGKSPSKKKKKKATAGEKEAPGSSGEAPEEAPLAASSVSPELSGKPSTKKEAQEPGPAIPEGSGEIKGTLPERTEESPLKTDVPSKSPEEGASSGQGTLSPGTVHKDKAELAESDGRRSSKEAGQAAKKPHKSRRKGSVRDDRKSSKMLSEEMISFKSDQQTVTQTATRTQDTSLHSILKRHPRTKDGSKKGGKGKKDAHGEAAESIEKRSKASEELKTPSGSGIKTGGHKDVSPKEPEVPEKGSTSAKDLWKGISEDEDKGSTKGPPTHEGSPHETARSTTAMKVESETGERASKASHRRKSSHLKIDAAATEQKDPDASAIEKAQKQSLIRQEQSELGEKELDDFLVGFELALAPYRVLVGIEPAPSDHEGATKKGAKHAKGRKHDKKRRTSIVRIHKSDIERKRKKGQNDTPSTLIEEGPKAAEMGEEAPGIDQKKKKRKGKKSRDSSSKKARKAAAIAEQPGAGAAAAGSAGDGKPGSGEPEGLHDSQPALKEGRSAHDSDAELPGLRELEEEDEEDAKKEKEKRRKKEGGKKGKGKRKKRKRRKKRDRPIGYRSGNATCRVLCPIVIGFLFAVILLFMLLRALAAASTATFPTTVTLQPFTPSTFQTAATTPTAPPPVPPPVPPTVPPTAPPIPSPVVPTAGPTPVKTPVVPPITSPPQLNVYLCPTETCKREGAYVASLLKSDSKPCDDLLGYVCDSWSRENPVNPSGFGSFVSRGTLIQDALQQELLNVIRNAPDEDLKVAAALHESCAKRPVPESALAFMKKMFSTWVVKTWPCDASVTAQTVDVWQFAAELYRDLGISALLAVTIGGGRGSLPQAVVELDRPQLLLEKGDERFDEVHAVLRGAVEEAPFAVFNPHGVLAAGSKQFKGSSQELVNQTRDMFFKLAYLPSDGQPYSTLTQERWTSVEFRELDWGVQYFLRKLFDNIVQPGREPVVVLKSPVYVRGLIPFVNNTDPVQILNYMGFLVLVRLAPFFPDRMLHLRRLFANSMIGRSTRDLTDTSTLCLLAVESLLPDCIAKAAAILRNRNKVDFGLRDVLSRLKSLFGREIHHLAWLGELSSLFMRYNLRNSRAIQFGPRPGSCVRWHSSGDDTALKRFFEISLMRQQERLQAVLNYSVAANLLAFQSDLDTEVRYDPTRYRVHVPATILNASTHTNESFFAFHLPRVATRLYRAMVKMLMQEEPYGGLQKLVPGLTENSTRALNSLLNCIGRDMTNYLKTETQENARAKAVLEQAVAIHLAFRAFRELLHVRRIWNLDYRLPDLPNVSSDQLFFIYFALDNCHTEDAVYHNRLTSAGMDDLRVGVPLKYLPEFSDAFQCGWQPACKISH